MIKVLVIFLLAFLLSQGTIVLSPVGGPITILVARIKRVVVAETTMSLTTA